MLRINWINEVLVIVVLVLVGLNPLTTKAEQVKAGVNQTETAAKDPRLDIDDDALAILKKATDYVTGLEQFCLKGYKTKDVIQESGQMLQFSSSFEACVLRPNRMFASRTDDDGITRRFWYDGKIATIYDEGGKVYGQIRVPETIDEMLDYLETVMDDPYPLADLLYNDLSYLSDMPLSIKYAGVAFLAGIACDHLAFRSESLDWQLWIDRGEEPLFRKIVITYKEVPLAPQLSARMTAWDIQPSLSDTLFQFSIPEGARRIQVVGSKRTNPQKRGEQ